MNPDPLVSTAVRGGSWYNDREPYHRATVPHQATSTKGGSIGFRTFRPSRQHHQQVTP